MSTPPSAAPGTPETETGNTHAAPDFTLFGAGLAGSLMALYLGRAGHSTSLYERRADPRIGNAERGRSINLALSTRGVTALREVGLAERVLEQATPMYARMVHATDGTTAQQPYSSSGEAIYSVSRSGLNHTLLDATREYEKIRTHFDAPCASIDFDRRVVQVANAQTGVTKDVGFNALIGADGAASAVRRSMQQRPGFSSSQTFERHGYKELRIPPTEPGEFAMEPNALHIWPRGGYMLIALPNQDRSFTCTLFWPNEGPISAAAVRTGDDAAELFNRVFPDALPLMPTLKEDFEANPNSPLGTVRCAPWNTGGSAVLIGDAAHAIVPFYGQGMNASFEDCRLLAAQLAKHNGDTSHAFPAFAQAQRPNADTIASLALANYIEMRDSVGSPLFRLKKKWERLMAKMLPGMYRPLYEMVSFSNTPYAGALRRARGQDAVVLGILGVLFAAFLWRVAPTAGYTIAIVWLLTVLLTGLRQGAWSLKGPSRKPDPAEGA